MKSSVTGSLTPENCRTETSATVGKPLSLTRHNYIPSGSSVDVTVYYGGFHGDLNETMFVGKVDEASGHLVQTAYDCMTKAIEIGSFFPQHFECISSIYISPCIILCAIVLSTLSAVRPGVKYRDVGNVIQKHAQTNGCSVVRSYCGHGINQ